MTRAKRVLAVVDRLVGASAEEVASQVDREGHPAPPGGIKLTLDTLVRRGQVRVVTGARQQQIYEIAR